jgi:hypothetical protein
MNIVNWLWKINYRKIAKECGKAHRTELKKASEEKDSGEKIAK